MLGMWKLFVCLYFRVKKRRRRRWRRKKEEEKRIKKKVCHDDCFAGRMTAAL
jgi:hypothetical protein